ncbi:hypothetical protein C8R44DRAFT_860249 [Mycena epipterygia]|nr:hypothetical protein C8R44DRAFT_860249 [Mycena epipterygia]
MEGSQANCPPFLFLPTEILLEIIAYYHSTPVPFERYRRGTGDDVLFGRFDVLRALSQTCRDFRSIFLPLAWENIEALEGASDRMGRHIFILKRRMMGILKTPSLPQCVRSVLVSLTLSAPNWNLFTVFVRFLQATPNLSALHIVDISERHAGVLVGLLQPHSFLPIRDLTLPTSLSRSLSAFPNIHSLICADTFPDDYDSIAMFKAAGKHCHSVQNVVNFMPSIPVISCLVQRLPLVETLRFRHIVAPDVLPPLSALKNLRSIEFPHRYPHRVGVSGPHSIPRDRARIGDKGLVDVGDKKLAHVVDAATAVFRASMAMRQDEMPAGVWVRYLPSATDAGDVVVRVGIDQS